MRQRTAPGAAIEYVADSSQAQGEKTNQNSEAEKYESFMLTPEGRNEHHQHDGQGAEA